MEFEGLAGCAGLSIGSVSGSQYWMWKPFLRVGYHKSRSFWWWFCTEVVCCLKKAVIFVTLRCFRLVKMLCNLILWHVDLLLGNNCGINKQQPLLGECTNRHERKRSTATIEYNNNGAQNTEMQQWYKRENVFTLPSVVPRFCKQDKSRVKIILVMKPNGLGTKMNWLAVNHQL
jgi:hypothetical protein